MCINILFHYLHVICNTKQIRKINKRSPSVSKIMTVALYQKSPCCILAFKLSLHLDNILRKQISIFLFDASFFYIILSNFEEKRVVICFSRTF